MREKKRGAAAKAQVIELVQDELGLAAALVGILLVSRGWTLGDPLASVVVATVIAITAIVLFRDNLSFLLGRSPGLAYLAEVERLARTVDGVLGVHDLRAEYIGPDAVHAGLHIEIRPGTPIEEADRIAEEVEQQVHQGLNAGYCVVHVDPVGAPR